MSTYLENIQDQIALLQRLPALEPYVDAAAAAISAALAAGGKVMLCGNGGSAADAQHLAAELIGRFVGERRALAALALSTDTSALTCIGNDYSFEHVFSRQVQGIGRAGDVLVCISTSGNSWNVVKAESTARSMGISTVGLLGNDGGVLVGHCDVSIVVPSAVTARIQEAHILIGHSLCGLVEERLGLT